MSKKSWAERKRVSRAVVMKEALVLEGTPSVAAAAACGVRSGEAVVR